MAAKKRVTRKKTHDWRHVAFTRFMLIVAFFVIWIGGISVRLVHLQVNQHSWLKEQAQGIRRDVKKTRMFRGTIYDRNERALAISSRVRTLYANPTEIEDVTAAAKAIAGVLKIDQARVVSELRNAKEANRQFLPLAKKLDDDAVQKINKAFYSSAVRKADEPNFEGLHWQDEQKRFYPNATLAAQVVGFSNVDGEGRAGVEMSMNDALRGAVIQKVQERDRLGRVYDETEQEREEPSDVILTIDAAYQYIAEQALEAGVLNAQAKSGMVIVMDPKTGAILALANHPTFDPNTITETHLERVMNHAVQSGYAPGSVFKLITYGSALEKKLITPEGMISSDNGEITVARHTFRDSHAIGTVNYTKALAHSSNVCAIKTGLRVGKDDFYGLLRKMGFGSKTGIELPAEASGIVHSPAKWYGDSLASMSIGYEINVTALQMTSAFATIANNGVKAQPHIIKEIRRSDEEPGIVTQVQQTQVVTAETARDLRTMLREVVVDGTGRRAALNGYTVAGKTGTAWKVNNATKSVDSSKYMSSFIGMAPADDPRIVVAVVMDEPTAGSRDGGFASAPVFREIAQRVLHEMKVPTDAPVKPAAPLAQNAPVVESAPETSAQQIKKPRPATTPGADKRLPDKNKAKAPEPNQPRATETGKISAVAAAGPADIRRRISIQRRRLET